MGNWENMYDLDPYAKKRVIMAVRLLLPHLKGGDTVTDLGCFTQFPRHLLPSSVYYRGLDSKAYHKETSVLDLNNATDLPHSTHYICLETLEHLLLPSATLSSIALAVSGYAVFSLPNEATLFHRIRCLLGTVDADCFQDTGKHLHLPSLRQTEAFLSTKFEILCRRSYISPTAVGCKWSWVGKFLSLIPESIHQALADLFPSLFARGFIFLCKHKT